MFYRFCWPTRRRELDNMLLRGLTLINESMPQTFSSGLAFGRRVTTLMMVVFLAPRLFQLNTRATRLRPAREYLPTASAAHGHAKMGGAAA